MPTPKFKRRLKRTLVVLTILFLLLVRLFAVFVLSEPFFGGHPIKTDNSENFSDLQFLDTVVAAKQIVGMGEATHGSKDFFTMKARMFQYLALKHGYKIFAIEADFAACQ